MWKSWFPSLASKPGVQLVLRNGSGRRWVGRRARSSPYIPVSFLKQKLHKSLCPRNSMVPWFLQSSGDCRSAKAQVTWPQREGETHGPQTPEEQEVFFKGGGRARAIYTTEMSVPGPKTRKSKKQTIENHRQPSSQQGIKTGSRKMEPISPTFLQDMRQKATSIAACQQLTHAPRAQGKRSDPQKLYENHRYASPWKITKTPQSTYDHSSFTDEESGAVAKTRAYSWQGWTVSTG